MVNVIETLTDDSQILLLYLSEELPEADRQTVEGRLAIEPALGQELEQLRGLYGDIRSQIRHADELVGTSVDVNAMASSVGREIRRRMTRRRSFRPWIVSAGVAAAAAVVMA